MDYTKKPKVGCPRATIGAHDIERFQPRGKVHNLQVVARLSFCTGGPSRLGRANASSRPVSTLRYLSVACMFWNLPSPMFPQNLSFPRNLPVSLQTPIPPSFRPPAHSHSV